MTSAAMDPLTHVLSRLQRVLGPGRGAEDGAVAVLTRFTVGDEPAWLRRQPPDLRLDVLTVCELLARRRG